MFKEKKLPEGIIKKLKEGNPPENDGLFGIPPMLDDSSLVVLGVPWEVTASFGRGTSKTPGLIVPISQQLDLMDPYFGNFYEKGIYYEDLGKSCYNLNKKLINTIENVRSGEIENKRSLKKHHEAVHLACEKIFQTVYEQSSYYLKKGKKVSVLGGDHSAPLGLICALGDLHKKPFGILHIDAHHDLRKAYEGYEHSHASIMYNVTQKTKNVKTIVSVGIRDFSYEEMEYAKNTKKVPIHTFYDHAIENRLLEGESFSQIAEDIVSKLPEHVYVSFDIDGLDASFCPQTGTPVPGGRTFSQMVYLLNLLIKKKKKVIGFDLCEVGSSHWDLIVGSRMLYKLCGSALVS